LFCRSPIGFTQGGGRELEKERGRLAPSSMLTSLCMSGGPPAEGERKRKKKKKGPPARDLSSLHRQLRRGGEGGKKKKKRRGRRLPLVRLSLPSRLFFHDRLRKGSLEKEGGKEGRREPRLSRALIMDARWEGSPGGEKSSTRLLGISTRPVLAEEGEIQGRRKEGTVRRAAAPFFLGGGGERVKKKKKREGWCERGALTPDGKEKRP